MTEVASPMSETDLRTLAERVVHESGCELVELRVRRSGRRWTVRLDIDRAGVPGVSIDDCQRVSRAVEAVLDQDDVIPGSYTLEVSSPGIDRPIETEDDIRRNAGRDVAVTASGADGNTVEILGTLVGLDDGEMVVRCDDGIRRIPMARVVRARQQLPF